jgi:phospholipid transport system substrate-binding protein
MRYWIAAFLVMACPFNQAAYAAVSTVEDVRNYVNEVGRDVIGVINTKEMSEPQVKEQLQQIFLENVDIPWMGRFALGQAWQKATPQQRDAYLEAYRNYLLNRYTANFKEYSGSDYTITDIRPQSDGEYLVGMDINTPKSDQQNIKAGYRIRPDENGEAKISDIIIEGVSLINTQRADFGSVLQSKGIDALTESLKSKTGSPDSHAEYGDPKYFIAIIYTGVVL